LAPLNPISYADAKRKLNALGFEEVRQTGSHVKFVRVTESETRTVIVPRHSEIAVGTLRSILRQGGISTDDWTAT